ncbi:unnamed protein product [Pieris brassicae]|uniref:Uncharacterized protein n=1 Tax=Pieris brassicae TaxID=7116 RepID=A0A9P0TK12_PIEBR|nr:unnamed protein product [Pieris brassicae]
MILPVLMCLLSEILAYQRYDNFYDRNYNHRSINQNYFDNNFSEDEINAINEYKKGMNFRASVRHQVFDPQFENRRVFGWIKKLFKKNETKKVKYEDLVNNKIFYLHLTRNLTDNLSQLTKVLDKFTNSLKDQSIISPTLRITRSVNDSEILEAVNTANGTTDNVTTTENITNRLRTLNTLDFKLKLLSSINDTLNIVLYKFKPASNAQEVFGDNLLFNVGFLSGSASTLKAFIDELQNISKKNVLIMDENFVMQLYDTVDKINGVSDKLLNKLNLYMDKATRELEKN